MNEKNQITISLSTLLLILALIIIIIMGYFIYQLSTNKKILSNISKIEISVLDETSTEGIMYTKPITINNKNEINTLLNMVNSSTLYPDSEFNNDYGVGGFFEGSPLVDLYTSDSNVIHLVAFDNFDPQKNLNIFYISKSDDYSDKVFYKTSSNLQKYIEELFNKYK